MSSLSAALPPALQLKAGFRLQRVGTQVLQGHAASTQQKYFEPWQKFKRWMALNTPDTDIFSCNSAIIAYYISELMDDASERRIGPAIVDTFCASVSYSFQCAGLPSPCEGATIKLLRRAADRILTAKKSKCEAIQAGELCKLLDFHFREARCKFRTQYHLTLFLLQFVGLLRFDDLSQILVHHNFIQFVAKSETDNTDDGVMIFIPTSKTDQEWNGNWVAIGATGNRFCPVFLLKELLRVGKFCLNPPLGMDSGPLLRAVKPGGHELAQRLSPISRPIPALTYNTFRGSIQAACIEAGLVTHLALHSGRVGAANAAAAVGADSRLVCHVGRWKVGSTFEDTYLRDVHVFARECFKLSRLIWQF